MFSVEVCIRRAVLSFFFLIFFLCQPEVFLWSYLYLPQIDTGSMMVKSQSWILEFGVKVNGFSSSYVLMWELDLKEGWVLKNRCLWIVVLAKTLESPLDFKKIKPVNPKANQPWIFFGKTEAEAPILWPFDAKSWLIGKDTDLGTTEGKRGRRWQKMIRLDSIADSMDMNLSKLC